MGKAFWRWLEIVVGAALVLVPPAGGRAQACEPERPGESAPRHGSLTIRTAQLDKAGLTLEFSEPVRSPSRVDPSQFRLTFAYVARRHATSRYYSATETPQVEPWTVYSALGGALSPTKMQRLQPNRIRIPAGRGLDLGGLCKDIARALPGQTQVGVYLHYAGSAGAASVQSEAGEPLAPIAPYWRAAGSPDAIVDGVLPGSPIPVKLTCR